MSAVTAAARRAPKALLGRPYGASKGLLLSHFIGISLLFTFAFDRVLQENIPFFYPTEIPMRLIAVWLIVDRNWRYNRVRFNFWDWTYLLFFMLTAVGIIYNSLQPSLPITYEGYRRWLAEVSKYYLAFLVVREATNRVGFRPDIMFRWLYVAFAYSAFIGIAQAMNLFGVRIWSYGFYHMVIGEGMSALNQARGTSDHANNMAFEMLIALGLVASQMLRRGPKLYEFGLIGLYGGALIATQSRGGLITFFAACFAAVIYLLWNRRVFVAVLALSIAAVLLVIGLIIVQTYNIQRFKRVIYGEKVKSTQGLGSYLNRLQGRKEALRLGAAFPLFGTSPNGLLYYNPRFAYWSKYGTRTIVDGIYFRMFADEGIVGLAFVFCLLGYLLHFVRRMYVTRPYALTAFMYGGIIASHGLVDNFVTVRAMVVVNIVVALASSKAIVSERGRAQESLEAEPTLLPAGTPALQPSN